MDSPSADLNTTMPSGLVTDQSVSCGLPSEDKACTVVNQLKSEMATDICDIYREMIKKGGSSADHPLNRDSGIMIGPGIKLSHSGKVKVTTTSATIIELLYTSQCSVRSLQRLS